MSIPDTRTPPPPVPMDAVLTALRPHLEAGVRNIYIWDGNHSAHQQRQLAYSPELAELVQPYGRPTYIIESPSYDTIDRLRALGRMEPDARNAAIAEMRLDAEGSPRAQSFLLLVDRTFEHGARVISPDPRADLLNDDEHALLAALQGNGHIPAGDFSFMLAYLYQEGTAEQRRTIESLRDKLTSMDLDAIDAQINATVGRRLDASDRPEVVITLYGAGHFVKSQDLDERAAGVSIAVVDGPGGLRDVYNTTAMQDLPDYAYYIESGRVVRLDTPETQMEFTGALTDTLRPAIQAALQLHPTVTPFFDQDRNSYVNQREMEDGLNRLGLRPADIPYTQFGEVDQPALTERLGGLIRQLEQQSSTMRTVFTTMQEAPDESMSAPRRIPSPTDVANTVSPSRR